MADAREIGQMTGGAPGKCAEDGDMGARKFAQEPSEGMGDVAGFDGVEHGRFDGAPGGDGDETEPLSVCGDGQIVQVHGR